MNASTPPKGMLKYLARLTDAERDMVEANIGIAYKYLNHPKLIRYTLALGNDDARQEALLGLIDAVKKYKSRPDCNFATFAWYRVRSQLATAYRFRAYIGRSSMGQFIFTLADARDRDEDGYGSAQNPDSHDDYSVIDNGNDVGLMLECLSPRERHVATMRLMEMPFSEIARRMKVSKQRTQQIWERCVHKIRHSFPQYAEAA